jgi:hypothetical protein
MKTLKQIPLIALIAQVCLLAHSAIPTQVKAETDDSYFNMDLAQLIQVSITSVSKRPQNLADTPAAAYVITQDDIIDSGGLLFSPRCQPDLEAAERAGDYAGRAKSAEQQPA